MLDCFTFIIKENDVTDGHRKQNKLSDYFFYNANSNLKSQRFTFPFLYLSLSVFDIFTLPHFFYLFVVQIENLVLNLAVGPPLWKVTGFETYIQMPTDLQTSQWVMVSVNRRTARTEKRGKTFKDVVVHWGSECRVERSGNRVDEIQMVMLI